MGSKIAAPPINEGVNLLNSLAPTSLDNFRESFTDISDELMLGRLGGEGSSNGNLNKLRAAVLIRALEVARERAETELVLLSKEADV
jgi:hypothetical protein